MANVNDLKVLAVNGQKYVGIVTKTETGYSIKAGLAFDGVIGKSEVFEYLTKEGLKQLEDTVVGGNATTQERNLTDDEKYVFNRGVSAYAQAVLDFDNYFRVRQINDKLRNLFQ